VYSFEAKAILEQAMAYGTDPDNTPEAFTSNEEKGENG
jgi:hypothetical protein